MQEKMAQKLLVIFSDPSPNRSIRLDHEHKVLTQLSKTFEDTVAMEIIHASAVDDIHDIIGSDHYDYIQFSGHGSPKGILLDKSNMSPGGELVSASRLSSLLANAEKPPKLVVMMACYSSESISDLSEIAPFVITATNEIGDDVCIGFVQTFYEKVFSGFSISKSYEYALHSLAAKDMSTDQFRLDRRGLLNRGDSVFVESTPHAKHNSILVNLDAVRENLDTFDLSREELLHLIAKKMAIHYWIFNVPRERCLIPIGRLLFGEFTWDDADDVVFCKQLMKLRSDIPLQHWEVWHRLLISYNDLASSEYRILSDPASPIRHNLLTKTLEIFRYHLDRYLLPARQTLEELELVHLLPYISFVSTHCEAVQGALDNERFPQVIKSLEEALTNYHDLVDALRPPEQEPS